MACVNLLNNQFNNLDNNTIADLLRQIERIQQEATRNSLGGCETCMIAQVFNTKPVAIYTCNGRFAVPTDAAETAIANLFRVEDVRGDDTVLLRLITDVDGTLTCTAQTVVMRIDCICSVQCFDPINCPTCRQLANLGV